MSGKSDKLDRFTQDAQSAFIRAQDAAHHLNQPLIEPEHLLLALSRAQREPIVQILRALDVEPVQIMRALRSSLSSGPTPLEARAKLSPRAARAIELSVHEARALGDSYIGVEHLLLGVAREGEGIAADVLRRFGIDLESLRALIARQRLE